MGIGPCEEEVLEIEEVEPELDKTPAVSVKLPEIVAVDEVNAVGAVVVLVVDPALENTICGA